MRSRFERIGALAVCLALLLLTPAARASMQAPETAVALSTVEATRAAAISAPVIAASPTAIDFGNVTVGTASTRSVTVSNTGDQPLHLFSVVVSDPQFTTSFTSQLTIAAGGSSILLVSYSPIAAVFSAATITLVSDAQNGPLLLSATGTGVPTAGPGLGAGRILMMLGGESAGDQFGNSVASAGDLNGDGFDDVIAGAWANDGGGGGDVGRAYIFFGGTAPTGVPARVLQGQNSGDNFGTSVASAGDVNGDGFPDVIVGAWGNSAGGTFAGRAYVYFGGPNMDMVADRVFTGQASGDRFGVSVSSAGDVNGDGYADVVVGASGNNAGGTDAGRAYVYFGGPSADNVADWILTGVAVSDNFGYSATEAGDTNGDGYGDLIVGAYANDAGGIDAGRAYVFFGGPAPDSAPDLILTGEAPGDRFGVEVAPAGDVNGDGRPDVIVGADFNSVAGTRAGRAYVFYGGPGADNIPDRTFTGDIALGSFGGTVCSAGDVDGDGYSDLLVGAWLHSGGGELAGRAYLFHGGPAADTVADAVFTGRAAGDRLGVAAAPAGDVDHDGLDDLILGAYFNDDFADDAGSAYVVSMTTSLAPIVTAPSTVTGSIGTPISFTVTAADPDGDAIASLTAAPLPAGAAFTANGAKTSGTFAWTPSGSQAGTIGVTFTASNEGAGSATTTIVVGSGNQPPVVTAPASVLGAEGVLIAFAVHASDVDGDRVTFGVLDRPVGSVFVDNGDNSGNFSWTPGFGQMGAYTVVFTGRDPLGAQATPASVAIVIDNVNRTPAAAIGGPYAGVVNVTIQFDGTGSSDPDGDLLSYAWYFGDLATGSGPTPSHAYAVGGVFAVMLVVSDETLSASASTTATVQEVFPASAFLEGGNQTTRLNSGKAETCVQVEPVDRSYLNSNVSIASIVMISAGTGSVDRITTIANKTTIGADRNRDGIDEITACFAKTDLRLLFSSLSGGRHTVAVALEGSLTTGGRFRTTLEMDVVATGGALAASVSPNPLNPAGSLTFRTTLAGPVTVTIFDAAGRRVRTVLNEPFLTVGYHDATIDGRRDDGAKLASGVYFYRVETAEGKAEGRIVVLK